MDDTLTQERLELRLGCLVTFFECPEELQH